MYIVYPTAIPNFDKFQNLKLIPAKKSDWRRGSVLGP